MAMKMDISAPNDEASPSMVNPVSTFPTIETTEEMMDKLLTHKIQEYCEGKMINDHDQFAMLELNNEKLKTFTEKLGNGQITLGFKLRFLETMQEGEKCKFIDISTKPNKFKVHSKMKILA